MTLVLNLSPSVIHDYLRDGIQVTKVGSFYSNYLRCPTRFDFRGALLFNANLIDLFIEEHHQSDFSNYAHDTVATYFWKLYQTWRSH